MQRNLLESFVIFLIAAAVAITLTIPKYSEYQTTKAQLAQKQTDLKNREQYFASLAATMDELKKYGPNLAKIQSALPSDPMASELANFLQMAASQSELTIKDIDYSQSTSSGPAQSTAGGSQELALKKFEMSLSLAGSYVALKDFLQKIEKSSRLIEVEDLTMSPPAQQANAAGKTASANTNQENQIFTFQLKLMARNY